MIKHRHTNAIYFLSILFVIMIIGCNNENPKLLRLQHIDNIMDSIPEEAFDSLLAIKEDVDSCNDNAIAMKYRLLEAKAQNKLFLQMPTDSVFSEVVRYYTNNGTDNEKMLSLYILGCIYRDKNNAPKAIEYYQDAIHFADTTENSCDFKTLFRIYGQMAELFVDNKLFDEALVAHQMCCQYALKAGDVYQYIRAHELVGGDFYAMKDTMRAISIAKECVRLYEDNNMPAAAAAALPTIIFTFIAQEKFDAAREYIRKFETEGGLFNGEKIETGREYYYFIKGLYFLGIQENDSAEMYFRKVLEYGYFYDGYRGLAAVFKNRSMKDSVLKYTELTQFALEENSDNDQSNDIIKVISDYNIRNAKNKSRKSVFYFYITVIVLMSSVFLPIRKCLIRAKMKKACDFPISCDTNTENSQEETRQRQDQKTKAEWNDEVGLPVSLTIEEEDLLDKLDKIAKRKTGIDAMPNDWAQLLCLMQHTKPKLFDFLTKQHALSDQELRACILICFGFSSGDISVLMKLTSQRVSNIKASLGRKLFDENGARNLTKKLSNLQRH